MTSIEFEGIVPEIHQGAWVAPTVILIGRVVISQDASIFYNSVLRADGDEISIGMGSNVQDGCVLHADPDRPVTVGARVSVGHLAILHGCVVGNDCLIGMGAVVLNGARIGRGSLVAAGAVVPEDMDVPPGSLVAGVPAKIRRKLAEEQIQHVRENAAVYLDLAKRHRRANV